MHLFHRPDGITVVVGADTQNLTLQECRDILAMGGLLLDALAAIKKTEAVKSKKSICDVGNFQLFFAAATAFHAWRKASDSCDFAAHGLLGHFHAVMAEAKSDVLAATLRNHFEGCFMQSMTSHSKVNSEIMPVLAALSESQTDFTDEAKDNLVKLTQDKVSKKVWKHYNTAVKHMDDGKWNEVARLVQAPSDKIASWQEAWDNSTGFIRLTVCTNMAITAVLKTHAAGTDCNGR
jgi:hypothetical protein